MAAQCDSLIQAILRRRDQLIDCIRQDKELRMRALKEQVATCTSRLQQTTALLQFCIEALKETDSSAFLQVKMRFSRRWCPLQFCFSGRNHADRKSGQHGPFVAQGMDSAEGVAELRPHFGR